MYINIINLHFMWYIPYNILITYYSKEKGENKCLIINREIDGKNNISIHKNIIIYFSENILTADNIDMIHLIRDNMEIDYVYHINKNTLIIDPNENLDYNSTYKIIIPSKSVKDTTGQYLEEEYTLNFTTITDTVHTK